MVARVLLIVETYQQTKNLTAIQASAGGEYSFNLRQSDIVRYGRAGTNLEITLADGRVILLENFFDGSGTPVLAP